MATKTKKFESVAELVGLGNDDMSIMEDMEREIEAKVEATTKLEKTAADEKVAADKAREEKNDAARNLELDMINKMPGADDRIKKLCKQCAVAEKLTLLSDKINADMGAEIAKIRGKYDVERDKADKMAVVAIHIVRENLDMLMPDYPIIASACVPAVVDSVLNPKVVIDPKKVKSGSASLKRESFTVGQAVYMDFKNEDHISGAWKTKATATGVMLYGKDTAYSTASKALADKFKPKPDGTPNNMGANYWKGTPKPESVYVDVSAPIDVSASIDVSE